MKKSRVFRNEVVGVEVTPTEKCKLKFEAWRRGMNEESYLRALAVAPNEMKPRRGVGEILVNAVGITIE